MVKKSSSTKKRKLQRAIVHIQASFNNTIFTLTDSMGAVIASASGGSCGFKGTRKSTPFAAQVAAESIARNAMECGVKNIEVRVSGPGAGRETALRSLQTMGLKFSILRDVTPLPHNGCRPPKKRRV